MHFQNVFFFKSELNKKMCSIAQTRRYFNFDCHKKYLIVTSRCLEVLSLNAFYNRRQNSAWMLNRSDCIVTFWLLSAKESDKLYIQALIFDFYDEWYLRGAVFSQLSVFLSPSWILYRFKEISNKVNPIMSLSSNIKLVWTC